MKILLLVVSAVAFALALVFPIWRMASRRRDLPCPVWLRWFVELDNPFTRTNRAAEIVAHLDLEPGMQVLDMGCGPGRLTIPLARAVGPQGRVVAMDVQEGMLRRTREKAEAQGLTQIEFLRAPAGEGKADRNRFDRAIAVTVLGEIPDRQAAMNELAGALKPDGILSVTEVVFDPHFQRRRTVEGLARAAGLEEAAFFGNRIAYTLHFRKPPLPACAKASGPLASCRHAYARKHDTCMPCRPTQTTPQMGPGF